MTLSTEAVLALAPDASSAKSARDLVVLSKWPTLGSNNAAAWGECQGSGSKPYQTQVDLSGPAFKCSCPSRKFPCKHGLALLLLRAQQASAFGATEAPAWVAEWLASRADKAQKKEEQKQVERSSAPADPEAQVRREAQRWQRIEAAAQELQRWLADQVSSGLGSLNDETQKSWQTMARRMVDAQAPGLGQRVRDAADGVRRGADWPERTLARLGLLQLACEAFARRVELPQAVQADLRVLAGWPLEQAEVIAQGERVSDLWCVLGMVTEEREGKLIERRVWLQGQGSGRRAWLLDHAFGGRGFETAWLTGTAVEAELAFFPGTSPLRALPAGTTPAAPQTAAWPSSASIEQEWLGMAQRVALNPWVTLHPLLVPAAVPLREADGLCLVAEGRSLPLHLGAAEGWKLLAASGGHPLHVMGEWDGHRLAPLSAWCLEHGTLAWTRSVEA